MHRDPSGGAGRAAAEQAAAAALVWTVVAAGSPPASLALDARFLIAAALGAATLAVLASREMRRSALGPVSAGPLAAAAFLVSLTVLAVSAPGRRGADAFASAAVGAAVASVAAFVLLSRRIAGLALARLRSEQTRAIEQAKSEWERTFDTIPEPVYLLDSAAQLVRANRATVTFLSLGFPDALGRSAAELGLPAAVQEQPSVLALDAFPGRVFRHQGFPASEGRAATIHVLEDVTQAEALRQRVVSAERQAALGELVGRVAHDVRNPLFGIAASARALRDAADDGADVHPALEHIERETRRLTVLMEGLLDLRRPATSARVRRPIDTLLLEACASARLRHREREVRVDAEPAPDLPMVDVDEVRVAQVFGNLLDNAILSAQRVVVRVRTRADGAWLVVEFADSGPGLSAEARRRAFEPFFSGRPGGSGLGLKIAKDTMEEHGGEIAISDSELGGAQVALRFPTAGR